jgi:hypothetical protein
VIAQPGNAADDAAVVAWLDRVFAQPPGAAPQLTPMMVHRLSASELRGESAAMSWEGGRPAPPRGPRAWLEQRAIAVACAATLVLVLVVTVLWGVTR